MVMGVRQIFPSTPTGGGGGGAVDSVVGQTGVVTTAQVFAAIKTVDGAGSGLDADLLDGVSSAGFQVIDAGLTSLLGVDTAADRYGYTTAANTWASGTINANGRSLIADPGLSSSADLIGCSDGPYFIDTVTVQEALTALGTALDTVFLTAAAIAAAYQPLDADLTAIAARTQVGGVAVRNGAGDWSIAVPTGDIALDVVDPDDAYLYLIGNCGVFQILTNAADKIAYFVGAGGMGTTDFKAAGRSIVGWSWTLGDTMYGSGTNTVAQLAGNTTTTRKFLRQVGNGTVSAAPAWDTLAAGDIPVDGYTAITVSGSTYTVDIAATSKAKWTAAADFTVANPTNPVDGAVLLLQITQDGTGGWRATWGSAFYTTEPIDLLANGVTVLRFVYSSSSSKWVRMGARNAYAWTETGASYTIRSDDSIVNGNRATAQAFTLPALSTVADDYEVTINQMGAGQITITRAGSDTLTTQQGTTSYTMNLQYDSITLRKRSATDWGAY